MGYQLSRVSIIILCKNGHTWKLIVENYSRGIYISAAITKVSYEEYIKSTRWQMKADDAKERANYRCQLCNVNVSTLHAHHRTYERLGNELPEDITVLCPECHRKFHGIGQVSDER